MTFADNALTLAVVDFASQLALQPESQLTEAWPAASEPGGLWHGYDDNLREVAFAVYLELRRLAVEIESSRPAMTTAQRALAQHHVAYRDLTGALAGVRETEFDVAPDEREWPLRTVLYHIALTERGFHALIHWAVKRQRDGNQLPIEMPDDYRDAVSDRINEAGSMTDVLVRLGALHARVLTEFAGLTDTDLDAPNIWWEGYEIPVQFRLHRFNAHLREHTIQVDKTLAGIGHQPTEPERLARLIHNALGQLEGALIGAPDVAADSRNNVTAWINTTLSSLVIS